MTVYTDDRLIEKLDKILEEVEAGRNPTAEYLLSALIQQVELSIVSDKANAEANPSHTLNEWMRGNLWLARGKEKKNETVRCIKEGKWYIYCKETLAIYREQVSRGYVEAESKEGKSMCEQVQKADRMNNIKLTLPARDKLRASIRIKKAHNGPDKRCYYDFGEGLPAVNAQTLLEVMSFFPDNPDVRCRGELDPIYISSYQQDAILFPVRKYLISAEELSE